MKLQKLRLKNFFRYGPNEQEIDLSGNGMALIDGLNGYGKSTIIYAIIWAIYGKSKQALADDVVNRIVGKDCKVSLDFIQDGKNYTIIRYRKHTEHENEVLLFEDGNNVSGKGTPETNQRIVDVIKMPYIAFVNSTIFSGELYSKFLGAHESERLQVFENILSLKEITLFYTEVKAVIKELETQRQEKEVEYKSKVAEVEAIAGSLKKYKDEAKEKLLLIKADNEENKKLIEKYKKENEENSVIDIEFEKSKLGNTVRKNELEKRLEELQDKKYEFTFSKTEYEDANEYLKETKNFNYEEAKEIIEYNKKTSEKIESLKKAKTNNSFDTSTLKFEKTSIEKEEQKLNEQKKSLESDTCPYCGGHMDHANDKIEEINKRFDELNIRKAEIDKSINDLNKLKEEQEEWNKKIDTQLESLKLKDEIYHNPDFVKEKISNSEKIIKTYEEELNKNTLAKTKDEKEKEELKEKISGLDITKYSEEYLNNLSKIIEENNAKILECENNIKVNNGKVSSVYSKEYVTSVENTIEENKSIGEEKQKELEVIDCDLYHYNYLASCFSNKSGGFKKYFIGEMIDVFNEKLNQYLPFFFNEDVEISFNKDLKETIKMDGVDVTYQSFSRGQKGRAELSISFALFDLSRIFFSNDNNFLCVDEMLDGLDAIGVSSAIKILKSLANESKVFVVSHSDDIKDEFTDVITIKRDENGFSVIEEK